MFNTRRRVSRRPGSKRPPTTPVNHFVSLKGERGSRTQALRHRGTEARRPRCHNDYLKEAEAVSECGGREGVKDGRMGIRWTPRHVEKDDDASGGVEWRGRRDVRV